MKMACCFGLVLIWPACGGGLDISASDTPADALGEVSHQETHALVVAEKWVRVVGAEDPWDGSKPAEVADCTEAELELEPVDEGVWFEINTKGCAYVTVAQPLLAEVPKGALLTLRIWHFKITTWTGIFHLAYQVGAGNPPEWELEKEVPSGSGLIYEQWPATRAYRAGEQVFFHVQNHGDNSWNLIEFSATY